MTGVYLFDYNQRLVQSIAPNKLLENTQTLELGGQITAQVKYPYEVENISIGYFGVKEETNFWLYKIVKETKDAGFITLQGIHVFFDDLKGCVIRDIRNQQTEGSLVLEKLLSHTGWILGRNEKTVIASKNFYYQSALSAFYEAAETWHFEFVPRIVFDGSRIIEKRIDIYNEIKKDVGKWFEYGDKLLEVVEESSSDALYTAFIGRGKGLEKEDENGNKTGGYSRKLKFDSIAFSKTQEGVSVKKPIGVDYIEIKEATATFGYPDGRPRIGVVDFDDIEDAYRLAEATFDYALANCRPKVQLRVKAVEGEVVELGETVRIIRPDMGIRYKARVFKIQKDFLQQRVTEYEFGDKIVQSAADRLKAEARYKKAREDLVNGYMEDVLQSISKSYFNDSAYNYDLKIGNSYQLPAGYYSFDAPIDQNPTKVIYMGAGKLLIANSKKTDGSWNWRTAATADGLVADEIVGTLGVYAKINAKQINVNDDFDSSQLGKAVGSKLKVIDDKIVDETGKVRNDLKLVDGKIVDLEGRVVIQDTLYNNVKITQAKGIQVLDSDNRERVQLGNWAADRYGLKLTDKTGARTVLDDEGILQSWQDGRCDNVDAQNPLKLHLYIPKETKRLYKAALRIYTEGFRAYSKATKGGGGDAPTSSWEPSKSSTSKSGGGDNGTTHGAADVQGEMVRVWVHDGNGRETSSYVEFYKTTYHEHKLQIEPHDHDFDIPGHNHTVRIEPHDHELNFGIYQEYVGNVRTEIYINGSDKTSAISGSGYVYGDNAEMDMTSFLKAGWNEIEVRSNGRCRVDATVFIQALVQYAPI